MLAAISAFHASTTSSLTHVKRGRDHGFYSGALGGLGGFSASRGGASGGFTHPTSSGALAPGTELVTEPGYDEVDDADTEPEPQHARQARRERKRAKSGDRDGMTLRQRVDDVDNDSSSDDGGPAVRFWG